MKKEVSILEQDLSITLEGFDTKENADYIGNNTLETIRILEKNYELDISKLRKVVISVDFPSALQRITSEYQHRLPSSYTDSSQAVAIAKTIARMGSNGQCDEYALILSVDFFREWFQEGGVASIDKTNIYPVFHRFHHELVHIHEKNTLAHLDQRKIIGNYDDALLMLATSAWSEYLANFLSSTTAPDKPIIDTLETLERVLNEVPSEISAYVHKRKLGLTSLDEMHFAVRDRVKLIANMYAYSQGYIDGGDIDVEENFPELNKLFSDSILSKQLSNLGKELFTLKATYDNRQLKDYDAFSRLTDVIDSIYRAFGLQLKRTTGENGADLYIHIS